MPHVLCMPGGSGGAAFPLACSSPRCSLPAVRVCRHCLHSPATDAQVRAEAEPGDLHDAARMLPTPVQPTGWDPAVPGGSHPSASLPTHSISRRAARPRSGPGLGVAAGGGQTQHQIWLAGPTVPALCHGECAHEAWSKARASWWDWLSFSSQSSLGSSTCVCVCVPWGRSLPSQHHPGITPALSFTIACMSCFFSWCFEAGTGACKGNVNLEIAWFAPNLSLCALRDKTNPCPSLLLP